MIPVSSGGRQPAPWLESQDPSSQTGNLSSLHEASASEECPEAGTDEKKLSLIQRVQRVSLAPLVSIRALYQRVHVPEVLKFAWTILTNLSTPYNLPQGYEQHHKSSELNGNLIVDILASPTPEKEDLLVEAFYFEEGRGHGAVGILLASGYTLRAELTGPPGALQLWCSLLAAPSYEELRRPTGDVRQAVGLTYQDLENIIVEVGRHFGGYKLGENDCSHAAHAILEALSS